jgi:putative hydrolases of HD superfamily
VDMKRLQRQIEFLIECERLKTVLRQNSLIHEARRENSAEHSWQLALMAMVLGEHANEKIDSAHVIKMVLIHDLVEVYCGDVFVYDVAAREQKKEHEEAAAQKLFALLPEDQRGEFHDLWREFEEQRTIEARFAAALDRLAPMIANSKNSGGTWRQHNITEDRVRSRTKSIQDGSKNLWQYADQLICEAVRQGNLKSLDSR